MSNKKPSEAATSEGFLGRGVVPLKAFTSYGAGFESPALHQPSIARKKR